VDYKQALNSWLIGSKEYLAGKTFEYVIEKYGLKRDQIIRLAGNESTIGTSPQAIAAAAEAVKNSNYYDEPASESLITALESKFKVDGINMDQLGIVVGNGMDSIIEHLLMLFTNNSSSIIDMSPTFIYYDYAARRMGVEVIQVKRDAEFGIDVEKVLAAVKQSTKIVFLCSPNNPDGSIIDLATIEYLADNLNQKNIILFADHAYIEFTDRKNYDARVLVNKYPNIVVGYTFSKAYALAGFRVGYALMSKELQAKYLSLITPFLCTRASIAAAIAALLDKEHFNKILANNLKGRAWLAQELKSLGYKVYDSQANFLLFSGALPSNIVTERLMAQGVIIRAIPYVNEYALRVTIGTETENQKFIKAMTNV
jgi:histidinol-phosphate aminotransferase